MLTALRGTKLHQRLNREGRLLGDTSGNNTAVSLNFIPSMRPETLINGYRTILTTIYAPRQYYQRVTTFLRRYRPHRPGKCRQDWYNVRAFLKSVWILGIRTKGRLYYWKLLLWNLFNRHTPTTQLARDRTHQVIALRCHGRRKIQPRSE